MPKRRIPDFPQRPLPDIPQPKQERIKIEIPELRGAPPLPDIQTTAEVETQDAIRAQQERYQEMLRRKKKQREQTEKRAESQRVEQAQAPQNTVTLSNLQQAVIWSEILGKPKARR